MGRPIMTKAIRNGLYSISTTLLDGLKGGQTGISVLHDGKMLGGGSGPVSDRYSRAGAVVALMYSGGNVVCTENLDSDVAVMKSTKDAA
jgi:hypothetical protein